MRRVLTMCGILACLAAAGCGDGDDDAKAPAATATASSQSAAAALRAELTGALVDHVYLAGAAFSQAERTGTRSPEYAAAADALDANSSALADTIAGAHGASAQRAFLKLWRAEVAALVDDLKGRYAKDEAAVQRALAELDETRVQLARQLADTATKLSERKVADDLKTHFEALVAVIDATVAKSTATAELLATAGTHAPTTAALLAAGIAADKPDRFAGDPDSGGATLRAALAGLFSADAFQTLLVSDATVRFGPRDAHVRAAMRSADEVAVALSQALSSVYGEDAAQQLLKLWRARTRAYAAYAAAKLDKDDDAATTALIDLDGYRDGLERQLRALDPDLPGNLVSDQLKRAVVAVAAAIRAQVTRSAKTFVRTGAAAASARELAATLAKSITAQFPERFEAG